MAQRWYGNLGQGIGLPPYWMGDPVAGVEYLNADNSALMLDSRSAVASVRTPALESGVSDLEILMKYRVARGSQGNFQMGGIGVGFRFVDSDNFVEVSVGTGTHADNGNIRERTIGSTIDTLLAGLFSSGEYQWRYLKVKASGTSVRVRAWLDGQPEPGTWHTEHTLTAATLSGEAYLSYPYDIGGGVFVQSIALATGADALPAGPLLTLSGTVQDEQFYPASRLIRVYRRDTGGIIGEATSDPVTGAFSIPVEQTGGYTVLCLDDEAGLIENDYAVRTLL